MMQRQISEADWKVFRRLREVALERFCDRALAQVVTIASGAAKGSHERYLEVCEQIQERSEEMDIAFEGPRRSTAFRSLAHLRGHGLLADEEFAEFSPETRQVIALILEIPED